MLYIDPSVITYIIQAAPIILIFVGGGIIALIIYLHDRKSKNNSDHTTNYPSNTQLQNGNEYVLKKDVYTKEEVESLIEEHMKKQSRD